MGSGGGERKKGTGGEREGRGEGEGSEQKLWRFKYEKGRTAEKGRGGAKGERICNGRVVRERGKEGGER